MKKFLIITGCIAVVMLITSCSRVRRSTGRAYMPDMYYSRAYETYASTDPLKHEGVNYNAMPVVGTMARGDMLPYPYKNDSSGYAQSASIKNPLDSAMIKTNLKEAERLYLVNCGICHGSKLDGNGPLWKGGDGPFPSAPKNFMADDMKKMAEGTMFHSVTFGKNMMGSYASQLSTAQRWMVIAYIKSKQGGIAQADSTKAPAVNKDSTSVKKP
jgi:mono/diheme cytochrome c family protein